MCPGTLIDHNVMSLADNLETNAVVTGNLDPQVRIAAHEVGMNVFELGVNVSEHPGMKRLKHQLSLEFPELKIDYAEAEPISKILKS